MVAVAVLTTSTTTTTATITNMTTTAAASRESASKPAPRFPIISHYDINYARHGVHDDGNIDVDIHGRHLPYRANVAHYARQALLPSSPTYDYWWPYPPFSASTPSTALMSMSVPALISASARTLTSLPSLPSSTSFSSSNWDSDADEDAPLIHVTALPPASNSTNSPGAHIQTQKVHPHVSYARELEYLAPVFALLGLALGILAARIWGRRGGDRRGRNRWGGRGSKSGSAGLGRNEGMATNGNENGRHGRFALGLGFGNGRNRGRVVSFEPGPQYVPAPGEDVDADGESSRYGRDEERGNPNLNSTTAGLNIDLASGLDGEMGMEQVSLFSFGSAAASASASVSDRGSRSDQENDSHLHPNPGFDPNQREGSPSKYSIHGARYDPGARALLWPSRSRGRERELSPWDSRGRNVSSGIREQSASSGRARDGDGEGGSDTRAALSKNDKALTAHVRSPGMTGIGEGERTNKEKPEGFLVGPKYIGQRGPGRQDEIGRKCEREVELEHDGERDPFVVTPLREQSRCPTRSELPATDTTADSGSPLTSKRHSKSKSKFKLQPKAKRTPQYKSITHSKSGLELEPKATRRGIFERFSFRSHRAPLVDEVLGREYVPVHFGDDDIDGLGDGEGEGCGSDVASDADGNLQCRTFTGPPNKPHETPTRRGGVSNDGDVYGIHRLKSLRRAGSSQSFNSSANVNITANAKVNVDLPSANISPAPFSFTLQPPDRTYTPMSGLHTPLRRPASSIGAYRTTMTPVGKSLTPIDIPYAHSEEIHGPIDKPHSPAKTSSWLWNTIRGKKRDLEQGSMDTSHVENRKQSGGNVSAETHLESLFSSLGADRYAGLPKRRPSRRSTGHDDASHDFPVQAPFISTSVLASIDAPEFLSMDSPVMSRVDSSVLPRSPPLLMSPPLASALFFTSPLLADTHRHPTLPSLHFTSPLPSSTALDRIAASASLGFVGAGVSTSLSLVSAAGIVESPKIGGGGFGNSMKGLSPELFPLPSKKRGMKANCGDHTGVSNTPLKLKSDPNSIPKSQSKPRSKTKKLQSPKPPPLLPFPSYPDTAAPRPAKLTKGRKGGKTLGLLPIGPKSAYDMDRCPSLTSGPTAGSSSVAAEIPRFESISPGAQGRAEKALVEVDGIVSRGYEDRLRRSMAVKGIGLVRDDDNGTGVGL
ncbi:hypothetical protein BJ138DRAFT_643326 [Hygrophoropsis aurantiaca]|uniref:Uncharacterized protein n=1 Tax=Hygrophoropsis aurantiaca TaxID=72124 RepID=A0ACB7ZZZ3_9AGAM|nr:hypothetical protein BJ138DRAFT_643326 [Hygrophoropsis aurantiaca]